MIVETFVETASEGARMCCRRAHTTTLRSRGRRQRIGVLLHDLSAGSGGDGSTGRYGTV